MQNFDQKVVLITGAASGFGKLLAEKLSSYGARLVLGDIRQDALDSVAGALPGPIAIRPCDVSNEAEVTALTAEAVSAFGRLDIAVNNAGIAPPMKSLLDTTEADMDRNFAVNTKGVFFGMKHQIPVMLDGGGGSILNVASLAGLNGAPKLASYVAAKHAVVGLTRTAAIEFARKNIRVNAVCPFYTLTPMVTEEATLSDRLEMLEKGSPMKRLGQPEEVVATMLSIIDPANSYLTGQAIAVDGGVSAI